MEVEVATLFQIIGEQRVQILELERQLAQREPVTEAPPVATMRPVSEEALNQVRGMFA